MASVIPFGQPILVGHHSEKKDRNYRARFQAKYGKSCQASQKADYYSAKAATVGTGGIASDDPEAISKLKAKLATLEAKQITMKEANKAIRKNDDQALSALGFTSEQIAALQKPDFCGRTGFADYQLTNNGAEIRRVKKRISGLECLYHAEPVNYESEDFNVYVDNGRIRIVFHGGKPGEEARRLVDESGFNWSRRCEEWLRKPSQNALYQTRILIKQLQQLDTIY